MGMLLELQGFVSDIKVFFVRKQTKEHGMKKLVDGPVYCEPMNVAIVEDVVTTGGSVLKAVDAIESLGHKVKVVACILDRDEGGRKIFEDRGIKFSPLLEAKDIIKKEITGVDWHDEIK